MREDELDAKQMPTSEGADELFYFDAEDGIDYFEDAIDTNGRSSSNLYKKLSWQCQRPTKRDLEIT